MPDKWHSNDVHMHHNPILDIQVSSKHPVNRLKRNLLFKTDTNEFIEAPCLVMQFAICKSVGIQQNDEISP